MKALSTSDNDGFLINFVSAYRLTFQTCIYVYFNVFIQYNISYNRNTFILGVFLYIKLKHKKLYQIMFENKTVEIITNLYHSI